LSAFSYSTSYFAKYLAPLRQGETPTLDFAIIGLQRLLASRHALKARYKAFNEEGTQSFGSTSKQKKSKKKDAQGDANDDDKAEAGPDADWGVNESGTDALVDTKSRAQTERSDRAAYLKAKKHINQKLRREWSDQGEKAKKFSKILLKFGTRDSGLAHSIASIYSAHEAVSFQPLELQLPRILHKIRAIETNASTMEALAQVYEATFSVASLLQSKLFRSMLAEANVRMEANLQVVERSKLSNTLPDMSLLDARKLENRRRKTEAKDAALIDPGDLLAACITVDECFRLFDDDSSGEIDVVNPKFESLISPPRTINL